jgi:hypothetical protein
MGKRRHISPEQRGHEHSLSANKAAAKFCVRPMNDIKWREVLALFREPECSIRRVLLKFPDRPKEAASR